MSVRAPRVPLASLLVAVALALAVPAWAQQQLPGGSDGRPVEINADNAIEWHQTERAYVARGHASAKRGETTVFADVLTAYYREVPDKGTEIFQLVAQGNVHIVSPQQEVFGDRAVYDTDRQLGVVTGKELRLVTKNDLVTARDTLEYYDAQNFAVARGDAVAVRNQDRMRADVLIGTFVKGPNGASELTRIDGSGNVVVTTPTDVATSDKLVYSVKDEVAVLIGDVKITRGDNQIVGEAAEMNTRTKVNRVIAGKDASGRVRGLLIPGSQPPGTAQATGAAAPAAR
ncbi:hypothetical protein HL658_27310 [Azospirillum sp. RWY-5-1]|uniref:Organic solvent tolerance-like N-terminal domain-containing protein n=1 Tax=Azospirillum oleiclasticum TaxID=2735135 RepID=A0ABX2THW3_9PROT|nr:LptA/OstA family protein [Azospirillum oleiclasticum]NYZ16267.1 hypothetical protein [Azospirillum oleiclasticum]NYZ23754.1 hypothetical protein [Azospirillum oleiclasticum]